MTEEPFRPAHPEQVADAWNDSGTYSGIDPGTHAELEPGNRSEIDPETHAEIDAATDPGTESGIGTVLASLTALEDRPVVEHVAVFEAAHDTLRAALDSAGDAPAAARPSA